MEKLVKIQALSPEKPPYLFQICSRSRGRPQHKDAPMLAGRDGCGGAQNEGMLILMRTQQRAGIRRSLFYSPALASVAPGPVPDPLDEATFRDRAQLGGNLGARHCAAIVAITEQAMRLAIAQLEIAAGIAERIACEAIGPQHRIVEG